MILFMGRRPIKRVISAVFPLAGLKYVEVHRDYYYWNQIGQFESKKRYKLHLATAGFLVKSPSLKFFVPIKRAVPLFKQRNGSFT